MGESVMAGIAGFECVGACDSVNTLLVEETILYPRLLRYCVRTLQRRLYVSLEEHIRRILRAWLNGKARLVYKR